MRVSKGVVATPLVKVGVDTPTAKWLHSFWRKEYQELGQHLRGTKVLEIGCGHGRDARFFLKKGYAYVGIDASEGLQRIAKRNNPKGDFRRMDLYALTFPKNSFDGIWSAATLLHVPKRRIQKVLRSIRDVLKEDGVAVVTIKEGRGERVITHTKYGGVTRFFAFYGKNEFSALLRKTGWKILKTFRKKEDKNIWLSFVLKMA